MAIHIIPTNNNTIRSKIKNVFTLPFIPKGSDILSLIPYFNFLNFLLNALPFFFFVVTSSVFSSVITFPPPENALYHSVIIFWALLSYFNRELFGSFNANPIILLPFAIEDL